MRFLSLRLLIGELHIDLHMFLHLWDETYFITVYDLFGVFLDSVCKYFIETFASMFIKEIDLKLSFFEFLCGLGYQ